LPHLPIVCVIEPIISGSSSVKEDRVFCRCRSRVLRCAVNCFVDIFSRLSYIIDVDMEYKISAAKMQANSPIHSMKVLRGTHNTRLQKAIVGAHPIIAHYIERLNIADIFRSCVRSDPRLVVSVADCVKVLIHNILTQHMALYKLPEWLAGIDLASLRLNAEDCMQFNDDRIARTLDAVNKSNRREIFFRIALRCIKIFEVATTTIHHDTTTVKLYGAYNGWGGEPCAANGHSKDYRPDLKQLVLGMNVSGDGAVPLLHDVYSGNRSDDSIHISNWEHLRRLLQTTQFMYTADSKLCTEKNLSHIEFYHGQYITVMPRTWKEDRLFRLKAQEGKVRWRLIYQRPSNRHPDSVIDRYYTTAPQYLNENTRRIVWIKSSQKAQIDWQSRDEQIRKTVAAFHSLNARINHRRLKQRRAIGIAARQVLRQFKTETLISFKLDKRVVVSRRYASPGRPSKDSFEKINRKTEYCMRWSINKNEILRQSRTDGVFPLITNNMDKSSSQILQTYKCQSFLEHRHSELKSVLQVAPVFLKKPVRVLTLVDIVVLSLTVANLMERDLRAGMKRNKIESLPVYPEQRECKHPTAQSIIRVFADVEKYEIKASDAHASEYFPPTLSALQNQILDLMGVPRNIFM
jgi:transposase